MEHRVIPRAEWGARYPDGFGPRAVGKLNKILHHSVTIAPDLIPPFDDDYAAIRTLESIGQSRFGAGISYHLPITPAGLIFEGVTINRVGSHIAGRNTISAGIVLVGNYDNLQVTEEQISALAWLLQEGVNRKYWQLPTITYGHRDLGQTACPGANAYARIGYINERASGIAVPVVNPIPVPPPPPAPKPAYEILDDDGRWGTRTTYRLQEYFGTPYDGVLSHQWKQAANANLFSAQWDKTLIGSSVIKALQRHVHVKDDGLFGRDSIGGTQAFLGTPRDNVISDPSSMVKEMQRRLNRNEL
jgi:hypothetical protein